MKSKERGRGTPSQQHEKEKTNMHKNKTKQDGRERKQKKRNETKRKHCRRGERNDKMKEVTNKRECGIKNTKPQNIGRRKTRKQTRS